MMTFEPRPWWVGHEAGMVELQTLVNCTRKLELAFKDRSVLVYLLQKGVISQDFFNEVDDPKSMFSPGQKAAKILTEIKRLVELDPQIHYNLLLQCLSQHKKYAAVVRGLNEEHSKFFQAGSGYTRLGRTRAEETWPEEDQHSSSVEPLGSGGSSTKNDNSEKGKE